jgi:hypothetical protein
MQNLPKADLEALISACTGQADIAAAEPEVLDEMRESVCSRFTGYPGVVARSRRRA